MRAWVLRVLLLVAALGGVPAISERAFAQSAVDLELVLAVDVSLSMDLEEQRLQRDGYVTAFRDPEVIKSIASGPNGRIAVTYVEWAGPSVQTVVIPWTVLDSEAAARAFSAKLEAAEISRARMTSISAALEFSEKLFASSGVRGIRRVIDVSGDGPNNAGVPIVPVRDAIVAKGIVINGLPLVLRRPSSYFDIDDLDRYYTDCVIGGTGAFVIPVREAAEFRMATRRKLLLEIAGTSELPAQVIRVQDKRSELPSDCLVGERRWNLYLRGVPN